MKALTVILLTAMSISNLDGRKFRCDYKYNQGSDGFLKYQEIPANWNEARLRCHLEGSKLASPLNDAVKDAMLKYIANINRPIFTGIHSTFSRGDFVSIEGVPLSQINHTWVKGEPDNENDSELCIAMTNDGKLADVPCTQPHPYICFKKNSQGLLMNECGTIDRAYNLETRTGSCYKFHQFPRLWSRAYMTCAAEGGHLVVINSENESKAMGELFTKLGVPIPYAGDYYRDIAHIGFHDWGEHGEWVTIHGDSLKDAGFDKFHPGEPNNNTIQFCGGMYRNGLLDDMWCHRRAQFICEKIPENLSCEEP